MKFNINDNIKLKITQRGRDILRYNHQELSSRLVHPLAPYKEPIEDSEGYITMQLWTVMHTFGPYMSMTGVLPMETEIIIEDNK